MAHFKTEVIQSRNECLKWLGTERDIYAGAIANLNRTIKDIQEAQATWTKTIQSIDQTKQMLLMVGVDRDLPPLDLDQEAPLPPPIGNGG